MDVRIPIGLLFTTIGALLAGYGLTADPSQSQRSLGWNLNLWWGAVLLVFGLVMLLLARRGSSALRQSAEGSAIESDELRSGKEGSH